MRQIQPTPFQRVRDMNSAKQNRVQTVPELPDTAADGDMVFLSGSLFIMSEGFWRSIDDPLMGQIKALQERLDVLEGDNG